MTPAQAVAQALGSAVVGAQAVSGGDVNHAARVDLADGRSVFVKHHPRAPAGMYEAEARGLRWLQEAGALPVPEVLAVAPGFLALQWVERGAPGPSTWEAVGHGLAAVHRAGAPAFGGPDGFIATLPQQGGQAERWAEFYGDRRLGPQVERMLRSGLGLELAARLEGLLRDLPGRVGPEEPPARLHGDLWGGNLLVARGGAPLLIDPAAYAGHREVDLAMMRLFGGFDERAFAAYEEAWPLAPGAADRVPLYQLHYLLVHVNLFGASWLSGVADCLDALGT